MAFKERRDRAKDLAKQFGYLHYMIERYLALWGEEETINFLEACEKPLPVAIRVNTLKSDISTVLQNLRSKEVKLDQIPWIEEGFIADFGLSSPGALLEHMRGFYYVQGIPSMTVSRVLDPQPDETVFDIAAAPGGKTTHIAQLMKNTGMIVAIEQDRLRIQSLQSNIMRCGVTNTLVIRGDASKVEDLDLTPDRILLDAPCSGEGLLPIDPERKTSKSMADIRYCATIQNELLNAAVKTLRPGGTMVYSTCSIAPEENEYVIDTILSRHPNMKVEEINLDFGIPAYTTPYGIQMHDSLKRARRLLPHLHQTEGFFICKLSKSL